VTSAIGGNIGIPLLVEVLSYNMQKIECYILAVLLSICFAKTIHACMGRIVVQESHKIVCKDCMLCRAGYQVQPPCHPRQVYDEKTLKEETCVPCNDGEYKQASNRENNSLSCRPCNVSSCGNFAVLSPCTKTSPVKCSEKCKDGYHKNDYSLCVPISSSSTAKTRNTPTTWTEFTRTVHPKMLDINHTKSVGSDSHGDKSLVIDLCVVIGIVCLFLGFLVAYCEYIDLELTFFMQNPSSRFYYIILQFPSYMFRMPQMFFYMHILCLLRIWCLNRTLSGTDTIV